MSSNTTLLCHTLQVPLTPELTIRILPTTVSDGKDNNNIVIKRLT